MDNKILNKLKILKDIYDEFSQWMNFYQTWEGIQKESAFLSAQKKAEELVEYSIKINRELLKKENYFANSYKESFLLLEKLGFEKNFCEKLSSFALFRNKLAHEYLVITKGEILEEVNLLKKEFPFYIKELSKIILD